jgi:Aminopeptidase P, N-terminal domain
MRRSREVLTLARVAAVLVLFLGAPLARPGELTDDLRARRTALLEALAPETLFVHISAPTRVHSLDVDDEYGQDSDMLYLTGTDQEGSILVLLPFDLTRSAFLFVPEMAFAVEPGLYVREAALEHLPDTPESRTFREAVWPAVERYRGIGVRVEDPFLLTEAGLVRLSAAAPGTVKEIGSTP